MSDIATAILLLFLSAFCICSGLYYYLNTEKARQKIIDSYPKQSNNKVSQLFFKHYLNLLRSPFYVMQLKSTGIGGIIMGIIILYFAINMMIRP